MSINFMAKKSTPQNPTSSEASTEVPTRPPGESEITMITSISQMQKLLKDPLTILVCRGTRSIQVQPLTSIAFTQARMHLALTPPTHPTTGQPDYDDPEFKSLLIEGDRLEMISMLNEGLPGIMIPGSTPSQCIDWVARNWTDRDVEELRKAIRSISSNPLGRFDPSEKSVPSETPAEPTLITSAEELCLGTSEVYTTIAILPDGSKVGWQVKPLPQELSQLADSLNSVRIPRRGKAGALNMNDLNYRRDRASAALAFKAFLAWYGLHEFDWEGPAPKLAPRMKPEEAASAIGQISQKLHQCVPRIVDFLTGEISNASQADLDVYGSASFF
jgi:hypothetical protein